MRAAPAVWELDGPIIFGPMTSNTLIKDMFVLLKICIKIVFTFMKKNTIDVLVIVLYHSLKKEANLLKGKQQNRIYKTV